MSHNFVSPFFYPSSFFDKSQRLEKKPGGIDEGFVVDDVEMKQSLG